MNVGMREKEFINAKEVADILGVSKSYVYDFLNSDECPFKALRLGKKRIVVPTNSFYNWYDSLVDNDEK